MTPRTHEVTVKLALARGARLALAIATAMGALMFLYR